MKKIRAHFLLLVAFFPTVLLGQPVAQFSAPDTTGCSPFQVQFTNLSQGSGLTYFWDFGNGNTSVVKDPYVQYNVAGSYTVTLVATDNLGNKDTARYENYITVYKGAPPLQIAASDTGICLGDEATFTLTNPDAELAGFTIKWDFGEGIVLEGKTVNYTYGKAGIYTLQVLAENTNGCVGVATKENYINVSQRPTVTGLAPAYFSCQAPYQFTAPSFFLTGGTGPYTYLWDYGDGSTSSGPLPSHQYQSEGTYYVILTVTDVNQCVHVFEDITAVTVDKPTPQFEVQDPSPCTGGGHVFTNTTDEVPGWPTTFEWDFGDGNTATGPTVQHSYATTGVYTVVMKITLNGNCVDNAVLTRQFEASSGGGDPISISPTSVKGCTAPFTVNLTGTAPPNSTLTWYFGDGNSMQGFNVQHTYSDTGIYDLNVRMTHTSGCTTWKAYPQFAIIKYPEAMASQSPSSGCKPLAVSFTDNSTSPDNVVSWHWDFDDENTSTAQNPQHVYQNAGTFIPRLAIATQSGCVDTVYLSPVEVGTPIAPSFTIMSDSGCLSDLINVLLVNLTDVSEATPQRYEWLIGQSVVHVGESGTITIRERPGTYDIGLVTVYNGCRDTLIKPDGLTITGPYANFTITPQTCSRNRVSIQDESVSTDVYYRINNQQVINSSNFNWTFPWNSANTIVQVAYDDETGCWDSLVRQYVVPDSFYATVTISDSIACRNSSLTLSATATHNATFYWQLSNGQTFTGPGANLSITQPGWHDVLLTAVNSDGCSAIVDIKDAFYVHGPVLTVTNSGLGGCIPFTVDFNGTVSSVYPLEDAFWVYDGTDTIPYTGPNQSFTVTEVPANQNNGIIISLVAVDTAGCSVSVFERIHPSWPQPQIQAIEELACGAVNYRLTAPLTPAHVYGNPTIEWKVDETLAGQDHTIILPFTTPGQHLVTLVMTDANGCTDSVSQTIEVDTILVPKANFTVNPSEGKCPPFLATFTSDVTEGYYPIAQYEWNFGDGTVSSEKDPQKIFTRPGNFQVSLKITDTKGCTDSIAIPNSVIVHGPYGEIAMQGNTGCTPLTVTLTADVHRTVRVIWDLGNGLQDSGFSVTHVYTDSGSFTPSMILYDSAGCAFSVSAQVKIEVVDPVYPEVTVSDFCFGGPTQFSVDEASAADADLQFEWQLGNGAVRTGPSFAYTYPDPGTYTVHLRTTRQGTCQTDTSFGIKIGSLAAQASLSDTGICMGDVVTFQFTGTSDTVITEYYWDLGDGRTATGNPHVATYSTPGIYVPMLAVANAMGCVDTIELPQIIVGDQAMPDATPIVRVSVESRTSISVVWEPTDRYDFSKYRIYRSVQGQPLTLLTEIADPSQTSWVDETGINTANEAYTYLVTQITLCGNETPAALWQPHTSIHLSAVGQVNSVAVAWTPYLGWTGVGSYTVYREVIGENIPSVIAVVDGQVNSIVDSAILCGESYRYLVMAQHDQNNVQSWSHHDDATPVYVPQVPQGQLRLVSVTEENHVQVIMEEAPANKRPAYYLLQRSEDGQNFRQVAKLPYNGILHYLDETASPHLGSVHYRLLIEDSCGDIGPPGHTSSTIFLGAGTTLVEELPLLVWTPYVYWPEGVRQYDLEVRVGNHPFVFLERVNGNTTVAVDDKTDLNHAFKYCYKVHATKVGDSTMVSYSNVACLSPEGSLHIPNAFTPDVNDLNDQFKAYGRYISEFQMRIYNRWGEELFVSDDINRGWDGTFRGVPAAEGVYLYVVVAKGANNRRIYRKGNLLLMR